MADEVAVDDQVIIPSTPQPTEDDWKNDPRLDENGNPKEGVPTTPVVPEVVPVTEPVVEGKPVVTEETPEVPPVDRVDFTAPIVKQIESLVTQAGLNAQDVAKAVMENGGKLPLEYATALVEKHGELVASLVADKLETFQKTATVQATEKNTKIFNKVQEAFKGVTEQSGAESWKELQTWTKENVSASDRKELNDLLKRGGVSTELAVDSLIARFKAANKVTTQEPELETGSNLTQRGLKPLTKAEYLSALEKAEQAGEVYGQSAVMARLDAQRLAGRQQNI